METSCSKDASCLWLCSRTLAHCTRRDKAWDIERPGNCASGRSLGESFLLVLLASKRDRPQTDVPLLTWLKEAQKSLSRVPSQRRSLPFSTCQYSRFGGILKSSLQASSLLWSQNGNACLVFSMTQTTLPDGLQETILIRILFLLEGLALPSTFFSRKLWKVIVHGLTLTVLFLYAWDEQALWKISLYLSLQEFSFSAH